MKKFYLSILFLYSFQAHGQAPDIQWQACLGDADDQVATCTWPTQDGGCIVGGYGGQGFPGYHGDSFTTYYDAWVVKLTAAGTIQWQKCLGGTADDEALDIKQTTDGGYIVACASRSIDGDVTGNHGGLDYWIVKLNDTGGIQWQKSLGGSNDDLAFSIEQTSDGGYISGGYCASADGDVTGHHANSDYWIVKLDAAGNMQWQKSLGGDGEDVVSEIHQTTDGGYIINGYTASTNGDVTGNHGTYDYWVVKITDTGAIQWQYCLGGSKYDIGISIQQTTDGGYIAGGESMSANGDVTFHHGSDYYDTWVAKLSFNGSIEWQTDLGGTSDEYGGVVRQTRDGGYIVASTTASNDGDVAGNHGASDDWLVKLSDTGTIEWQKCMGSTGTEGVRSLWQTPDSGYLLAGYNDEANDGDVSGNHGAYDYWVVKLSKEVKTSVPAITPLAITLMPNPTTGTLYIQGATAAFVKAYSPMGQLIGEWQNTNDISIAKLPAGMYFIKVFDERGQLIMNDKVVKM